MTCNKFYGFDIFDDLLFEASPQVHVPLYLCTRTVNHIHVLLHITGTILKDQRLVMSLLSEDSQATSPKMGYPAS